MKASELTIERELNKAGHCCSFNNLRSVKSELETCRKEDYSTISDALQDTIEELVSLGQLD